jgi:broad specificity phosphatase PhoE
MTRLALIRHGPTPWNREHRVQGRRDIPLDGEGAALVATFRLPAFLDGWDWLASPLSRARETARIVSGRTPPLDDRLLEAEWGDWEGRVLADVEVDADAAKARGEGGIDLLPPGGESPRMVWQRVAPLLAERAAAGRDTVAVTHNGVIRAIYAMAIDWDMVEDPPEKIRPFRVHVFTLDDAGWPAVDRINIPLVDP